ncbi:long-chain acyl-CoA synthetase [Litoreibacter ponti]|uniref:Long-chain-fatty-acid--CoA ligase n=1 Tax=Litoreibacter ponti TaxID=1510457 RepID=A0A2T6BEZ8_9RHOB|nr:AMP-binding protein [Litoreibacter ponti]PTX54643.1 long-chain acyl-CoA synthetase [Litoreibacter ponti]
MEQRWTTHYSPEAQNFDLANMEAQTIAKMLDVSAKEYGARKALTTILPTGAETSVTYSELRTQAEYFAIYLREVLNLRAGDTVALMTANCIGFGVASLGIAKAGCIATNINPLYTAPEMQHQLSDSNAQVLVIIDLFGDKVDQVIRNTAVRHVVKLSLLEFFAPFKRALLGFVLKRVKRAIPPMRSDHVTLAAALDAGRAKSATVDITAFTAEVKPTDTALYQYTSGTTGRSKGVELSHQAVLGNAYQAELMTKSLLRPEGDTALVVLPLYHITAYTLSFIAGLRNGLHCVLVPSPRPISNLKTAFEKHDVTWLAGINTLYAALLTADWFKKEMAQDIRLCASGGAAQTTGVAQKFKDLTGIEICQGYGMTECAGILTFNPIDQNRFGSVGVPVPGSQVRIVDDDGQDVAQGQPGEIIGRGPTLMSGYLNQPDATAATIRDGWLYSGDIGVMDADGFIEIVDRKKDMILVSGFNIAPNEIEDTISQLPGVAQVGVVGIPDDATGEAPAAFIVRSEDSLTEDAILAACRKGLTNYKIPKIIRFVDEVPVTLSGKVLRRELRETYLH